MLAFFFFRSLPPLPISPVWLPSRLLCSVVQFRTWLSFHIHFQSPSKSAPLIASMCIHSHNAEAEKWTANQRNPVHLPFRDIFEVCRSGKKKCYILWWIIIFEELVSLCSENLPCHCAELYVCQQLKVALTFCEFATLVTLLNMWGAMQHLNASLGVSVWCKVWHFYLNNLSWLASL